VDANEEPYLWILRGLPTGGDLPKWERRLAESAKSLLDSKPDVQVEARDPERAFYNLLELCARLRSGTILAEPLRSLRVRNTLKNRHYLGMDLRHRLRFALTHNQPDCDLAPDWLAMIRGEAVAGLLGTSEDGFEGLLHMKRAPQPEAPFWRFIADGLTEFTGLLRNSAEKVSDFAALLTRVDQRFPDQTDPLVFVRMSDAQKWPDWTDMALPRLFIKTGASRYVTWKPVYEFARQMNSVQVTHSLCGERILELQVGDPTRARLLVRVGEVVEQFRYRGECADAVMCEAWSAIRENRWPDWPSGANSVIDTLHRSSLASLGVLLS
jgi:hypothetical protein